MLRILLADDHELIRRGIRSMIESHEGWHVCHEAKDGREALTKALELKPDIVIVDITMPELNGLELTRRLRQELPRTEILVLSMHDSEQLVREVVRAGARSYVLKSDAGTALTTAIEALSKHKPYFSSRVAEIVLQSAMDGSDEEGISSQDDRLTPREREVVQLIAEGHSSKDIAAALNISVKTAETHRANLMRKLDMHSVSELVRYAIRNKIVGV